MTHASSTRRLALLATLAASVVLASCGGGGGGGSGSGTAQIRAVNLTVDTPSLDVVIGGNRQFSAQAVGALAAYVGLDANTYTVNVNATGNTSVLLTNPYTLAKDTNYTAVVWGNQSNMRLSTLSENEAAPTTATNHKLRFFNATTDAGSLDVYLTPVAAELTNPTLAALTPTQLVTREIPASSYRLRITGTGDPSDLRLDVPLVTLAANQISTLVITSGSGGVLVNGTLILQQGALTAANNTQARLRVVASVNSAGTVAMSVGGNTVAAGLRSPSLQSYALVPAGSVNVTARVNGNVVSNTTRSLLAGSDYTLLMLGAPATANLVVLTDDNRLPASGTRAKVRMVNGIFGSDPLTLTVDNSPVSSDVPAGMASAYTLTPSTTTAPVQVSSPSTGILFQSTSLVPVPLSGQTVYSMFMLAGATDTAGNQVATGVMRKDR